MLFKVCIVFAVIAVCVQISFILPSEHAHIVGLFGAIISYAMIS